MKKNRQFGSSDDGTLGVADAMNLLNSFGRESSDEETNIAIGNEIISNNKYELSLYKHYHPDLDEVDPSMDDVREWFGKRLRTDYVNELVGRLDLIHREVMRLGRIDPNEEITVPGTLILRIKSFSAPIDYEGDFDEA